MANSQTFTLNIKALFDASAVKAKVGELQGAFNKLRLPDTLSKSLESNFTSLNKALSDFESRTAKGIKTSADAKGLSTSLDKVIKEFTALEEVINKVQSEIGNTVDLSSIVKFDDNTLKQLRDIENEISRIKDKIANVNAGKLKEIGAQLDRIKSGTKAKSGAESAIELFKQGDIDAALTALDKIIAKQEQAQKMAQTESAKATFGTSIDALGKIREQIVAAKTDAAGLQKELGEQTANAANLTKQSIDGIVQGVNEADQSVRSLREGAQGIVQPLADAAENQVRLNSELDQVKSRIQYFFGLANSINLVKRAIRSAFDTVKELDAAMTETAVVTDHTISDMWQKLPEYTKRANQLGVSTLAAYQSATLYYQQGLNDTQAGELSVETLKMARIAGLEAADATDRMTNALRGFNMELNTTSAQRVDDVYSQLAAMSASNVDEISTAMTKVASLAHSANMEFETTAAFLAQIIETTRESAETAGTALKTVAARFSEVKKLVDTDQLKGQDEEGQVVDVNKVSAALRTAGIDLNKYFLGEVGLDDIFMELASKWDSLTNVQQRYIATQAAGSRQQSRFIALMQDYARTQQLVGAAYNAEGASARQFEKTQDSLQSKLARLKNAWNEFLMGITNSGVIKGVVDALTTLLNIINKLTGAFGPAASGFLKFGIAAATVIGGKKAFSNGGIATKAIGALGNTPVGKFLGLGGNEVTSSGNKVAGALNVTAAKITTGSNEIATAMHGAAAKIAGKSAGGTVEKAAEQAIKKANLSDKLGYLTSNRDAYLKANTEYQEALRNQKLWFSSDNPFAEGLSSFEIKENQQYYNQQLLERTKAEQAARAKLGLDGYSPEEARVKVNNYDWDHNIKFTPLEKLGKAAANSKLFGGLSSKIADAGGGKVGGALAKLFGFGESAAAAQAAAGLATAIGGITVAAGAAAIAIKLMYDASPAGQLKIAEKYADSMSDVAANAQKAASKIRDVAANTKEYESAIKDATSTSDREKAIQDQNEYILSILEEDATYAQYIQSTFTEGGQLYLTLDSDALAAAVDKIAEGATRASAYNNFANAVQQQQMADVYKSRLAGVDLDNRRIYDNGLNEYRQLTDEEFAKFSRYQAQIDAANIAMQGYAATAASQLISLEDIDLDSELSNLVASAIGETFNADDVLTRARQTKRGNWWNGEATDAQIRAEYSRLYGADLEKGYDKKDAQYAIALGQVLEEEIGEQVPDLLKIVQDANGKMLLEVITGSYEGTLSSGQLEAAFNQLSSDQQEIIAKLLDTEVNNISKPLEDFEKRLAEAQEKLKKETVNKLLKNGVKNDALLGKAITKLTTSQWKELNNLADDFAQYGEDFNNIIFQDITRRMANGSPKYNYEEIQPYIELMSQNSILAFDTLKQAAEDVEHPLHNIAEELGVITRIDGKDVFDPSAIKEFSTENLLQSFFVSKAYEEVTQAISDLIDENGKINSANIKDLAESSQTLAAILEDDIMSAEGLVNTINALESGNIAVSDLNDNVLNLFDSFETLGTSIDRALYLVKNFDPGPNFNEPYEFMTSSLETMQKMFEEGRIGGQFREYWAQFFNTDAADQSIQQLEAGLEIIDSILSYNGASFWNLLGAPTDSEGIVDDSALISGYKESNAKSYKEYLKTITPEGYNFSDNLYDYMVASVREHDYGSYREIAEIELEKIMEAYGDTQPTATDIQAIASGFHLSPEELLEAWKKSTGFEGELDLSDLEDRVKEIKTSAEEAVQKLLMNQGENEGQAGRIASQGAAQGGTNWLLNKLGIGADGKFDLGTLYANIQEVVPEVADGSVSIDEWIQQQIDQTEDGTITVPVEVEYYSTEIDEQGKKSTIKKTETIDVTVDSVEGLPEAINAAKASVQTANLFGETLDQVDTLTQYISELGTNNNIKAVTGAISTAKDQAQLLNDKLAETINKTINIEADKTELTIAGEGTSINFSISLAANGGIVSSYAKGSLNKIQPGLALTGEEAPEIVWNKEQGYAYLTGKHGPEIQNLQPGDEVFNGKQTKEILRRSGISSFAKGTIPSYALYYGKDLDKNKGGSGGGGGSSSKDKGKKESTWRNELDWLYDLMEDIAEYERQQTIIQSKYELALNDLGKTGRDLFNLTRQELRNLNTQYKAQSDVLLKRTQQMGELQTLVNSKGFQKYVQWNQKDQTLEINWDKIEAIQDKEKYDEVTEFINRMEEVQDQMDDAEKALYDIKKQIQELEERFLQQYLDFQKRVLDAVVKQYQTTIDNLSELNDTLNDANSSILDSLQKEIDLQRQIRDNTDTEQNIADMEARLAYLQRDTTGANAQEIRELEKQLSDARQDYSDTLIDQEIDRLNEANDTATTQREKQIELMQAQLDYWQESGGLWDEVADLIAGGFTNQGTIIGGSDLWEVLKQADSWEALSEAQKKNWANELILETNEVGAHLIQLSGGNAIDFEKVRASIATNGDLAIKAINAGADTVRASIASLKGKMGGTPAHSYTAEKVEGYASGGTATSTAMALLHGTPQEPEYVLNARQTDAFLRLADILPAAMGGNTNTPSNVFGGDTIFNIGINVDSIANDYDVDQLVERIKDDLADAAGYRNVNALSFIR